MTTTITYCANGCTRINADSEREPQLARVGQLCNGCINRLEKWLEEIPQRYALLPDYLLPSADLDRNPESKGTKQPTAPVPVRLAALDLLDERLGRRWLGTIAADERRGTIGTLLAIANEIRVTRGGKAKLHDVWVVQEADTIRGGLDTLASIPGIADIYAELKTLHRQLGDAVGQYPPKPVGRCPVDLDEGTCDGPLMPNHFGVRCAQCGTTWDHAKLRLLGNTIQEPA